MNQLPNQTLESLKTILNKYPLIIQIIKTLSQKGGRVFLVGGAVRDLLLAIPVKDLDIEVHGLTSEAVEAILKSFGLVSLVGKIFGVFRLHGLDVDWSLPRSDTSGRKPEVTIDPFMSLKEAFRRRDLTINAMGIDLITYELVDPFNGYNDLQNKVLHATDPNFFIEDPLRFYRVMQFIGRFQMKPDEQLNQICANMDIKNVSVERIEEEFKKLFLKSKQPSLGIEWLNQIGRLNEVLPELALTINVPQEYEWHPEGDVYEHTKQALDAAENLQYDNNDDEKLILLWAALCHDLGKITTTVFVDGRLRSHGHEVESEVFARKLLKRITRNNDLVESVCRLVRHHMQPAQLIISNSSPAAYKRLANKLGPYVNLQMLTKLLIADRLGRNPAKGIPLTGEVEIAQQFLNKIKELGIEKNREEPVLHGKDIMDIVEPGPKMGKFLKDAYEIQIEEGIKEKEELKKRVLNQK